MATRWGRPPLKLNIATINLLRAQGKSERQIGKLLGAHQSTINRRIAEDKQRQRTPPIFCVGTLNIRTALAIKRYRIFFEPMLATGEAFNQMMNELWIAARDAGCPKCGRVRRQSNSECRRCITIRLIIDRLQRDIAGTIQRLIRDAQKPIEDFIESLADKRGLRPAQRLQLLVEKISGRETHIQTEG